MRLCPALLFGILTMISSVPAIACSNITESSIFFPFNSSDLAESKSAQRILDDYRKRFGALNPTCVNFGITGASDSEEAGPSDGRIIAERIETLRQGLVQLGFSPDRIRIGRSVIKPTPPVSPGIINVPDRSIRVEYWFGKGRYRCDPATKIQAPICQWYGACYLELADGTVCNIDNVPDPRPGRYSVSPSGTPIL